MRVLFSGGGTMGSVTPLIAIAETIKQKDSEAVFMWLGTKYGPERDVVETAGIYFESIHWGKLRRYFDIRNLWIPMGMFLGFWQSLFFMRKYQPDVIVVAGGFVAVPVVFAGRLMQKKIVVHHQDVLVGLANKLMAPFANVITVSFEKSINDFPKRKVLWTGNPVRLEMFQGNRDRAMETFQLEKSTTNSDNEIPTVLITGGGTGSARLNQITIEAVQLLLQRCQIIHLTGTNKDVRGMVDWQLGNNTRYHQHEFLINEMSDALAVADLVISRAGLATLSELSVLGKASIIIPLPGQQEYNVDLFAQAESVYVLNQNGLDGHKLASTINYLLDHPEIRQRLSVNIQKINPATAGNEMADLIYNL
jgi:UDP-N-acetylglucosamine--N-acetylmuramyl-(pentapeptide) pyrophosphoryl-undecaprenol N-acetylglucosamine transferase